jgi:uncharacterized protein (DUF427 family)
MARSPGHRKWPDHKVEEQRLKERMRVEVAGRTIAESADAIRVKEDEHPDRYYFPRSDIDMSLMQRTNKTSECPFKGHANYYSLAIADKHFENVAWTYEDPYEEHAALRDRLAFYDDKVREIDIKPRI